MELPELQCQEEKDKFKNVFNYYSLDTHSAVVKYWLFDGISHRDIDKDLLGLDPNSTHGNESWKILHYLGIDEVFRNNFKETFKNMELKCIIHEFESSHNSNDYDELINVLKALDNQIINVSKDDIETLFVTQEVLDKISTALNSRKNIILNGVPGTGKTHLATIFAEEKMCENGYILTTATSDWTTFDTIGGLMPDEEGKLVFHEGKFLQAIRENKWLIIDEINRADIDKAFGQLFTVLSGQNVELPYSVKNLDEEFPIKIKLWEKSYSTYSVDDATYYIGKNWRIIATMNSYDKNSLFDLSYAFMRRFMFIEIGVPEKFIDLISIWKRDDLLKMYIDSINEFIPKLETLYSLNIEKESININRQLGPAIFLDTIKYIYHRLDLENHDDYDDKIFCEAINAFVLPQFEGLSREKLDLLQKFFIDDIFDDETKVNLFLDKLNELKPFY